MNTNVKPLGFEHPPPPHKKKEEKKKKPNNIERKVSNTFC